MRIMLYAPPNDPDGLRLGRLLERAAPRGSLERYDSLEALSRRLQRSLAETRLVVLVVGNQDELLHIASFQPAFEGVQILLVLPEQDSQMLSVAYRLRPRYVSYRTDEFADLLAIIHRKLFPEGSDRMHSQTAQGRKATNRSHGR